jgi:hypothetical protein
MSAPSALAVAGRLVRFTEMVDERSSTTGSSFFSGAWCASSSFSICAARTSSDLLGCLISFDETRVAPGLSWSPP